MASYEQSVNIVVLGTCRTFLINSGRYMNLQQALVVIGDAHGNDLPVEALETVKSHWAKFYPELECLMDKFIADETSLTDEENALLFFGTLFLAEFKYTPALSKCLTLFSRSDSFLTPLEAVFGDALTELTATLFYNVANDNTQALSDYIVAGHQAMYCKASAIEAVFAQYEMGTIDNTVITSHVTRWLNAFLALPSTNNNFLISVLADYCIVYQLDEFKAQFQSMLDKDIFDTDRITLSEVAAWDNTHGCKVLIGLIVNTNFDLIATLSSWQSYDEAGELMDEEADDTQGFDSLMDEGGLLSSILYDEQTIIDNSVPVSSLPRAGRNDPCPCGSGKKYKKCCLH